jgi:hypothetical protein
MPVSWWRRATAPASMLAAVAVLHGVSSVLAAPAGRAPIGDETVYLSQINSFVPPGLFTAPRARGLTFLVAPVTLLTPSVVALRVWLALVSSVLLYVCFRPWLRLIRPGVVALAALLFASLWTTVYYGSAVMPNLYVALGAVAATGLAVSTMRAGHPSLMQLLGLGLTVGLVALVRPSDAGFILVALVGSAVVVRGVGRRARVVTAAAVVGGFAAGFAEWVVEAFVRFGGPLERLHAAKAAQGAGGLHFALLDQARALAGPLLCRTGCHAAAPGWAMAWWLALPVLVAAGVWAARAGTRIALAVAAVTGIAVLAEYVVTVPYAAPRFLLPTYALLALPAANGLVVAATRARRSWRRLVWAGAAAAVGAQLVTQLVVLRHFVVPHVTRDAATDVAVAQALRPYVDPTRCVVDTGRRSSSAPNAPEARPRSISSRRADARHPQHCVAGRPCRCNRPASTTRGTPSRLTPRELRLPGPVLDEGLHADGAILRREQSCELL